MLVPVIWIGLRISRPLRDLTLAADRFADARLVLVGGGPKDKFDARAAELAAAHAAASAAWRRRSCS